MDFFSAQDQARSKTKLLVFYFVLAVIGIIVALYFAWIFIMGATTTYGSSQSGQPAQVEQIILWQPETFGLIVLVVVALVGISSLMKTLSLRSGGGVVARSLGGQKIDPTTTDATERRLLNVVEEMAIASGVPTPEVYLLPEDAINGFAAGFTIDDAAIAITRGCVEQLSRDELQGVVAHEFSHILNGDMRLNIKLMGIIFGILVIAVAGRIIMRSVWFGAGSRRRSSKDGGGAMAIVLFGLAVVAIGYIGVFFGRLIQSAVSRQREFLADAAAVQFTRNPDGIAGALKKIGGSSSLVANPHAEDTAHFFFASALKSHFGGAFATHPPIDQRIRAIEPGWDGSFEMPRRETAKPSPPKARPDRRKAQGRQLAGAAGVMGMADLAYAQEARSAIDSSLGDAVHTPNQARAVVFALLLNDSSDTQKQLEFIQRELGDTMVQSVQQHIPKMKALGAGRRLPVLEMTLPSLGSLEEAEARTFSDRVQKLIAMDGRVTLFEFAVGRVVKRYLQRRFSKKVPPILYTASQAREPFSLLLSAMVYASASDPKVAGQRFQDAAHEAGELSTNARLVSHELLDFESLEKALDVLSQCSFKLRGQVVSGLAHAAVADGEISIEEGELLRAVAISLECPLPPTLGLDHGAHS